METKLLELVSKIRFELFSKSKEVKYLTHLFRYFNDIYGDLNKTRTIEKNPSARLKSKTELRINNSNVLNNIFEQVYLMLKENLQIDSNASSDLMLIYALGLEAKMEVGELDEFNKLLFFKRIIDQYNYEFHSSFKSTEDFMLNNKARKEFESSYYD